MPAGVCPWWLGYCLASPLRRLVHDPAEILGPCIRPGMVVLEPGPGMGHFTLELIRLARPGGRVVAVDVAPRMLAGLRRRARKAGLLDGLETREAAGGSM
ncbi:MAG TPA: methyltransferase domain-containing protein, partial [Holophaga sp.]|nr:methyltransferase domain-containing protein [Holophaga sp.]